MYVTNYLEFNLMCSEWSDIGKLKNVRDIPLLSTADILFTARMKNKFGEWRDGLFQEQNQEDQIQGISNDSKFQVTFFEMHPALRLNRFTSHQLKLIQLVMFLHFVSSADMFTFCFLYRYLDCAIYLYPLHVHTQHRALSRIVCLPTQSLQGTPHSQLISTKT